MPLEVELFRNHKHSVQGKKLKRILDGEEYNIKLWFNRAKRMVEEEMKKIAATADEEGQIDAGQLDSDKSEMLSLFLENQETWQEVCLVLEQTHTQQNGQESKRQEKQTSDDSDDNEFGYGKALVLNRPMAFKLTENLGRLVLKGAYKGDLNYEARKDLLKFMLAFGPECAVYVGGPDQQGDPATMIHGIADLPGAVEISPGTNIYKGGIEAAVQGVMDGKYNPLEFRFFVGCHKFEGTGLDVAVVLGKYQPVACARSLALKQCISLPKPLWHEGE